MGKYTKVLCALVCALCLTYGTTVVIFAKNKEHISSMQPAVVNQSMAVIATVVMIIIGIAIFIKRNKLD